MSSESKLTPSSSARSERAEMMESPLSVTEYAPIGPEKQDSFVSKLLALVLKRWWVVLGVATLSTTAAYFWITSRPSVYTGAFQLLVEPISKEEAKVSSAIDPLNSANNQQLIDYDSQITVLNSESVLMPILRDIQRFDPTIQYEALKYGLNIAHEGGTSKLLNVQFVGNDPRQVELILKGLSSGFIYYSENQRNTSLEKGLTFLNSQIESGKTEVEKLGKQLENFRVLYQLYQPADYEGKLTGRLNDVLAKKQENQLELDSATQLYAKLQSQLGLTPNEAVAAATLNEAPAYQDLLKKLKELDTQIAIESTRFQDESPVMVSLRENRQKIVSLLTQEAQGILSQSNIGLKNVNPRVIGFQGSINNELGQELVRTANKLGVLEAERQSINSIERSLRLEISNFASVAKVYEQIDRALGFETTNLNRLLTARQNLQLEAARKTIPWQLISPIHASDIWTNRNDSKQLLNAFLASLGLGILAAWLVDQLDPVFRKPEELSAELKLAWLGEMPKSEVYLSPKETRREVPSFQNKDYLPPARELDTQSIDILDQDNSIEFFFDLYLRLKRKFTPRESYVLSVTSPHYTTEKSNVAFNLALAAAKSGCKVLLIDTNLRSPQLHHIPTLSNALGLNQLFSDHYPLQTTGSSYTLERIFQSLPQHRNLRIITAGQKMLDPISLLGSEDLYGLIDQFREIFGLIILDAPTLNESLGFKLVGLVADSTIIAVNPSKTNRKDLKKTIENLTENHIDFSGFVSYSGTQPNHWVESPSEISPVIPSTYKRSKLSQVIPSTYESEAETEDDEWYGDPTRLSQSIRRSYEDDLDLNGDEWSDDPDKTALRRWSLRQ
jgi:polysaccharide biosynthesis transport protein